MKFWIKKTVTKQIFCDINSPLEKLKKPVIYRADINNVEISMHIAIK